MNILTHFVFETKKFSKLFLCAFFSQQSAIFQWYSSYRHQHAYPTEFFANFGAAKNVEKGIFHCTDPAGQRIYGTQQLWTVWSGYWSDISNSKAIYTPSRLLARIRDEQHLAIGSIESEIRAQVSLLKYLHRTTSSGSNIRLTEHFTSLYDSKSDGWHILCSSELSID